MNTHYRDVRKIDPTRGVTLADGTPNDANRVEIGPTPLARSEWQAAGLEPPNLPAMRRYRLNRLTDALIQRDYGGLLVFDPLNIRYATDSTNMQIWNMHNPFRACLVCADGYMVIWDYKTAPFLSQFTPLVKEHRTGADMFYFARGDRIDTGAKRFAAEVAELLRAHAGTNRRLAVDKIMVPGLRALESLGLEVVEGEEVTAEQSADLDIGQLTDRVVGEQAVLESGRGNVLDADRTSLAVGAVALEAAVDCVELVALGGRVGHEDTGTARGDVVLDEGPPQRDLGATGYEHAARVRGDVPAVLDDAVLDGEEAGGVDARAEGLDPESLDREVRREHAAARHERAAAVDLHSRLDLGATGLESAGTQGDEVVRREAGGEVEGRKAVVRRCCGLELDQVRAGDVLDGVQGSVEVRERGRNRPR